MASGSNTFTLEERQNDWRAFLLATGKFKEKDDKAENDQATFGKLASRKGTPAGVATLPAERRVVWFTEAGIPNDDLSVILPAITELQAQAVPPVPSGPSSAPGAAQPPIIDRNIVRGSPPIGKRWFFKNANASFAVSIPQYEDFHKSLQHVCMYLETRELNENWGWVAFDVPGAGKSTTMLRAVQKTGDSYIRIKADSGGLLGFIVKSMEAKVRTLPDALTCGDLIQELREVVVSWLYRVFQKGLSKMAETNQLFVGTLHGNGPAMSVTEEELNQAATAFIAKMHSIKPGSALMLHFDDIQVMSSDISFQRKPDTATVNKPDYNNYFLIALTQILEKLRSYVHIKAVITGTNVFQDRMIRLGSEWKFHVIDLGVAPPAVAMKIWDTYIDLDDFTPPFL